jgi:hypothetical protein
MPARLLCHVYNRMRDPSSHSYAPTRHLLEMGAMTERRKQSHDDEKSRPRRINDDASCDLRTCICERGRIAHPGLARSDRRSDQQLRLFNASYPAMAPQTVNNNKYRYNGGPKSND